VLRHEEGHVVLDTVFKHEFSDEKDLPDTISSALSIDIDDCDCPTCEENRGNIQMYATLGISIHTKQGIYTQRLMADEARKVAEILTRFANIIDQVSKVEPNVWVSEDMV